MDKIIYGVYRCDEAQEYKVLEKCFSNLNDAEAFKTLLEKEEEIDRNNSKRCWDCAGINRECPLWVSPFDNDGECGEFYNMAFHNNKTFTIEEIKNEEED